MCDAGKPAPIWYQYPGEKSIALRQVFFLNCRYVCLIVSLTHWVQIYFPDSASNFVAVVSLCQIAPVEMAFINTALQSIYMYYTRRLPSWPQAKQWYRLLGLRSTLSFYLGEHPRHAGAAYTRRHPQNNSQGQLLGVPSFYHMPLCNSETQKETLLFTTIRLAIMFLLARQVASANVDYLDLVVYLLVSL